MSYQRMPNTALVDQSQASLIANADVPRSRFVCDFGRLMTFDAGYLVPFLVEPIYPGDHIKYDAQIFCRPGTFLFPIFSNLQLRTEWFFVPHRLVWDNFEKFMGFQLNPGDSVAYLIPQLVSSAGGFAINSIFDHMELPTVGQVTAGETVSVSSLPLRGYNRIWNEWYRDQDLSSSAVMRTTDTGDVEADFNLLRRAKSHDMFTSARPFLQKFTAPNIAMTGTAPVIGIGTRTGNFAAGPINVTESIGGGPVSYAFYRNTDAPANEIAIRGNQAAGGKPEIYANLALASATFTINALRQAWAIQSLYERDAVGGTRYIEQVWSHFKVRSSDSRMQRPEFVGGGISPVNITPIAQTTPTGGNGLGALGASGVASGSHRASIAAEEHGYLIGLISIKSEIAYQQGLARHWSVRAREELMWPLMAGLGEQAILMQEIYCTGNDAADAVVFGYTPRYEDLRQRYSTVTGMFRSTHAGTIDPWHLFQRFSSAPALNSTFVWDTPPMSRALAAGAAANNMQFLADIVIHRDMVRALPMYGTPSKLGRF